MPNLYLHPRNKRVCRLIIKKTATFPFTTRSASLQIKNDSPELRRIHAHLKKGTQPSNKLVKIKYVKHYLSDASIYHVGLPNIKRSQLFLPASETIIQLPDLCLMACLPPVTLSFTMVMDTAEPLPTSRSPFPTSR